MKNSLKGFIVLAGKTRVFPAGFNVEELFLGIDNFHHC